MFLMAAGRGDTADRSPYSDFWYGPVPGRSPAGVAISDETAMRLAIVYACVNVISRDIAKVPLLMFRRKDDGGRERVTDHPAIRLLNNPTRNLTPKEWKQRLQAHKLLRGNGYCHIRHDFRGRINELVPWKPDSVRVEQMPDESLRYHVRERDNGVERIYVEGEVMHLRGLSLDGPLGVSPIDQQREMLGEALAAQRYGSSFFANDARPSVWLEHPGHFKDEGQRQDWISAFKRMFGGSNRFTPMLMEYGIKIHDFPAVNHEQLQFIELRKMKGYEVCAMYRVPPHKVAILDRSTNNNIEHQGIEYVTDCLLDWCRGWEERLGHDLLTEDEREEYYFEFMLDALMRGDAKSRNEAYQSGIYAGWLTRNEVRQRENLDKLDDLDEPLQPVNMTPAGSDIAQGTQPATPSTDAPQPDNEDNVDEETRALNLELQARQRALNRETRALRREWDRAAGSAPAFSEAAAAFYVAHVDFVAQALVVSRDRATAYCLAQCDAITVAVNGGKLPDLLTHWEACAESLHFKPLPAAPKGKP
jgi:HK97 family phage portal protein